MIVRALSELNLKDRYATNRDDLIGEFYGPCLVRAIAYDRAVGYFRSSILLLAARSVASFAARGGKIRLICSPELAAEDIAALEKGYEWSSAIGDILRREIERALEDVQGRPAVEFLATLVAVGSLDLRVAFRTSGAGIFHDKIGVFRDALGNAVSFTGSINESLNAWAPMGNHESFDVFRSWTAEGTRVGQHIAYLESLWQGSEPGIEIIPFPRVARDRLIAIANPEGVEVAYAKIAATAVGKTSARLVREPLPHQVAALATWEKQGRRGILEHATGSGKTFTALVAIKDWLKLGRPVLVLVPSQLLFVQWYDEIRAELADLDYRLLLVGAGNDRWQRANVVEGFTQGQGGARLTLATLQTAASDAFRRRVRGGEHLFIVIDEVHRAGSPHMSAVLQLNTGPRLGLSATPRRYGDPIGTADLIRYFDGVVPPPFTLADAIEAERLCRYTYHVHLVSLTVAEADAWRTLTRQINKQIAQSRQSDPSTTSFPESVKRLLIRRADIVKKAADKVPKAVDVLRDNYETGQRWLVYCDDRAQLAMVLDALRDAGLPASEYHSAMESDRATVLDRFTTLGGILVAIKCLDEGVDIPSVDHALILASSRNPREFIQRRGRVLRRSEGKYFAEIHDLLVLPLPSDDETDDVAILKGELVRAAQFAQSAHNTAVAFELRRIAREAGIDPDGIIANAGFEDDEAEGTDE